ncbi:hypothetical protein [Atopobacter phocae]|uniref:hypothetical protein n=1 Tax=Atopobacter phocae TaxID=136492 RepID=UPI0004B294F8|nr:hypothetical protein [Atopobacter phocae]
MDLTKKRKNIKKLESIISKLTYVERDYYKFSNSLLNFYSLSGNKESSENMYRTIIFQLSNSNINHIDDLELLIKVRYNHCHHLWLENKLDETILEILETIDICKKHNHYYLLPDLYCLLGNVSESFSEKEEVKKYFLHSLYLYHLVGNEKMSLSLKNYIKTNF